MRNRADDQLSGVVFGVTHDAAMGRVAHLRLFGGALQNRDTVALPDGRAARSRRFGVITAPRYTDLGRMERGEVAALCGLSNAKVGDVLGEVSEAAGCHMAVPLLSVRVLPERPEALHELTRVFEELSAEDPLLDAQFIPKSRRSTFRSPARFSSKYSPRSSASGTGSVWVFRPPR